MNLPNPSTQFHETPVCRAYLNNCVFVSANLIRRSAGSVDRYSLQTKQASFCAVPLTVYQSKRRHVPKNFNIPSSVGWASNTVLTVCNTNIPL